MLTLLLALALPTHPAEVEVRALDGRVLAGTLVELSPQQVVVRTAQGDERARIEEVLAVTVAGERPKTPDAAAWIELVDGSVLAAAQVTVAGRTAEITLAGGDKLPVATRLVRTVRLQAETAATRRQWGEIVSAGAGTDQIVIRKNDATIDALDGIARDVTADLVQFELDGQVVPVRREKVYGLIYYQPLGSKLPAPICLVEDAGGMRLWARSVVLVDDAAAQPRNNDDAAARRGNNDERGDRDQRDQRADKADPPADGPALRIVTAAGLELVRPLASVSKIDFSAGKLVYVSDLEPEAVRWTPLVAAAEPAPELEAWYRPRRDGSALGGPLQLASAPGRRWDKGLGVFARTEIVYRLPGEFRSLSGLAGSDPRGSAGASVRLVIHGDDKKLFDGTLDSSGSAAPIELDVRGVRRLTILVDFGPQRNISHHVNLCDLKLVK